MSKIRKQLPTTTTKPAGTSKKVKGAATGATREAQASSGVSNRSILILDGVDLSQIEVRQRESTDPLTVKQGLHEIAKGVYGYGAKMDGDEPGVIGKLAQVALLAAERAQLDPDLGKMMKPGLKQSLNPTGQTQLTDKQLDQLADRLVSALSQVLSSS